MFRLQKSTAILLGAAALASCSRIPDAPSPEPSGDRIAFRVGGLRSGMSYTAETKAAEVTTASLTSIYVSASQGTAPAETQYFTNEVFTGTAESMTGNVYWPATDPGAHFYASNVPTTFTADGFTIAADNSTDVVAAYLASPVYKGDNTLTFNHVFSRLRNVTVTADDGYTISDVSITITPKVSGTYNIRTGAWSAVTAGSATSVAPAIPGTKANDVFLIPGQYTLSGSWKAVKGAYEETVTDHIAVVDFTAGKTTAINFTLGGYAKPMELKASVTPWDADDKGQLAMHQPLTFEAITDGTITWTCNDESIARTIQYRKNDGEWTDITSTTSGAVINVSAGDVLTLVGNNDGYGMWNEPVASSNHFGGTAEFYAFGDVSSLCDYSREIATDYCFTGLFEGSKIHSDNARALVLPATTLGIECYVKMFDGCTSLTSAPELPATTLADWCYAGMFNGCTSLTSAPELPATILANRCYDSMFNGCTSLTSAPELPATELINACYDSMFKGCTSLATAPELPATTLVSYCYKSMFEGCSSLSYIKCLAINGTVSSNITDWVKNVSSTGTFVKAPGKYWSTGTSGIPSGWTVQDAE